MTTFRVLGIGTVTQPDGAMRDLLRMGGPLFAYSYVLHEMKIPGHC